MVEISDIKDRDSLKAWLKDQPREVSVWMAARAAARVLPLYWQEVLTEDRARVRDVIALPVLRSVLISSVAALVPTDDIGSASYAYVQIVRDCAANAALNDAAFLAAAAATNATSAAAADANRVHTVSAEACAAAADAAAEACAESPVWQTFRRDAERVADSEVPDALSLWLDGPGPLADKWAQIKAQVEASPDFADWQFWLDWYDAQLAGRTLLPDPARTWEMLEKIALIDPATWDAGPEVANPVIREIWELYRLRAEVAALQAEKEAFLAARASHAQRNHNQPPDGLVDDQPELARQITIVWDSLDEARDALEQDAPDKGWLRAIAEKLLSALTAIAKYCAKVADTAVISAAKVGGGTVGTAVLDHVANNGRLLQFARDLLTYGGG